MLVPQPPYALDAPAFPFPALAALAGRAPLGGQRETVLACFVAARLVRDSVGPEAIPPSLRAMVDDMPHDPAGARRTDLSRKHLRKAIEL